MLISLNAPEIVRHHHPHLKKKFLLVLCCLHTPKTWAMCGGQKATYMLNCMLPTWISGIKFLSSGGVDWQWCHTGFPTKMPQCIFKAKGPFSYMLWAISPQPRQTQQTLNSTHIHIFSSLLFQGKLQSAAFHGLHRTSFSLLLRITDSYLSQGVMFFYLTFYSSSILLSVALNSTNDWQWEKN